MPFLVFLAVFGFTMPLMGKYIDMYSPRKMMILGAILVGLGWILASFSTNPWMLTILYGVIGGFGAGVVYNCPIATIGRWFPDRRGLATGLTVLGFGLAAAIVGPLVDYLTLHYGITTTLRIPGTLFLILIIIYALPFYLPPTDWKSTRWKPLEESVIREVKEFRREEMVKTKPFYALWICYTIGTLAGLLAIGVSKPVGLEVAARAGISEAEVSVFLTALVVPFAICNGIGRPLFDWFVDKLGGRASALISFALIFIASLLIFLYPSSLVTYAISFALLWLCLGSWLGLAPGVTAYFFGLKDYARNYGLVFTAYGAEAILGNILVGQAKDIFGTYIMAFPYVMILAILGMIIAITMLKPPK